MKAVHDWWRRSVTRELHGLRNEGRTGLLWSVRITIAAVASYVAGVLLFPGTYPLLAPLTAMLVVQVTPVTLLVSGLDRVVAVVAGVFVAVGFAVVIPLQWWSLGLLILVSITIGQVLPLRSNRLEVAISGMLVLGMGTMGAESVARQRIAETLLGAAVGIAANLLFPPKVASGDACRALDGLADSLSELLNRAADQLATLVGEGREVAPAARTWLDDARRITHDIPQVGAALLQAEEGRRLNVRAVGRSDVCPGLRQGLEALERSAVAIRHMFRALVDATHDTMWLGDDAAEDVWLGLAQTLRELAAGVDAFAQLVRDEADPATRRKSSADHHALSHTREGLHQARARLEDELTALSVPELLVLQAAVLSTVNRLLCEMAPDERLRRQAQLLQDQRRQVHVPDDRTRRARHPRPRLPRRKAPSAPTAASPEPTPEPTLEAATQPTATLPADRRSKPAPEAP
jgi:hypothetical protein